MKKKIALSTALVVVLVSSISIPSGITFASEKSIQDISEFDEVKTFEEISKYLEIDEKGHKWFNDTVARENGVLQETIDVGIIYNAILLRSLPDDSEGTWSLGYGNWCGKGNNGQDPIDVLDSLCKIHDECYAKEGWGSRACNREFVNNLETNLYRIKQISKRAEIYAKAAIKLFSWLS